MGVCDSNPGIFSYEPARVWRDAYPVGNGRYAAMVMGGREEERIFLNHEWLWRGKYRDRVAGDCSSKLSRVREAFFAGDFCEGTARANMAFGGGGGIGDAPCRVGSYQPAAALVLKWDAMADLPYSRVLSFDDAFVRVLRGACVEEVFAPIYGGAIGVRIRGWGQGSLRLERDYDEDASVELSFCEGDGESPPCLELDGRFVEGICWRVSVYIDADVCRAVEDVVFAESDELVLWVVMDVWEDCSGHKRRLSSYDVPSVPDCGWDAVFLRHVKEFRRLFFKTELYVEGDEPVLPAEERRLAPDSLLPVVFFNYGKYLIISSSAPCCDLPSNLQGKWNPLLFPPWDCDYHMDINLQMNYWPCEFVGLDECVKPLVSYLMRMLPSAREAAKRLFGARGIVFPITSDAWARSTPEAYGWDVWVGSAVWMAQHLYWRYAFGRDRSFMEDVVFPFIRELALFFEDFLVESPDGFLDIVPSQSPENRWIGVDDFPVGLCVSSCMDIQLVHWLFSTAVELAGIAGVEAGRWKEILSKLRPPAIGSDGIILEWGIELEEAEKGHRHLSPLWGVWPSSVLWDYGDDFVSAAERLLDRRVKNGCCSTGWSTAHAACLYACLGRADDASNALMRLLRDFTTGSLLGVHPVELFQIDANFGGMMAVILMLMRIEPDGAVTLLPALPRDWEKGRVDGLNIPGGAVIGFSWDKSCVTELRFCNGEGIFVFTSWAPAVIMEDNEGLKYRLESRDGVFRLKALRDKSYVIRTLA